jgi:hypothetical protein
LRLDLSIRAEAQSLRFAAWQPSPSMDTMHRHDLRHIADGVVGAVAIASTVLANPLLRGFYRKWGATEHETHKPLPGDELIPNPRMQYTRAISIKAPPERVWPWLIQIGYGRAGWYSYDVLEDMVGAGAFVDGESSERVVPELQDLKLGDKIALHEELAFRVHSIEPPRTLLLSDIRESGPDDFMQCSWAFVLEDPEPPELVGGTRLLIRWRLDYAPSRSNDLIWKAFVEPINFVMERKMMLGLKHRAEGS